MLLAVSMHEKRAIFITKQNVMAVHVQNLFLMLTVITNVITVVMRIIAIDDRGGLSKNSYKQSDYFLSGCFLLENTI